MIAPPCPSSSPLLVHPVPLYVRFADVDMMQVVHHAAYIHWFEQIRFHFLTAILGIDGETFRKHRISLPLIACEAQYRRPFRFFDEPVGYARVRVFKQAKVAVHYAIFKGDDPLPGVTGVTTHCFTAPEERLLLRTPEFIATAIATARQRHSSCFLATGEELDWRRS